jgi:hypothetical protein
MLKDILLTAKGGLIKEAVPWMPDPAGGDDKVYVKIKEDVGDFIYILKLENLDETGKQIEEDGVPVYNWYVGETINIAARWIQHKTRFYIEKASIELLRKETKFFPNFKVYEKWELEDPEDAEECSGGANWTLKHKPIEIVYLQEINRDGFIRNRGARKKLRIDLEEKLTKMMFERMGTEHVRGSDWCRVGSVGSKARNAYKDHPRALSEDGFIEDVNLEFGSNMDSYAKKVSGITRAWNNIEESDITNADIRTLKSIVEHSAKRKYSEFTAPPSLYKKLGKISLDEFLEKIDIKYPEGLTDEAGLKHESSKDFIINAIFEVKTGKADIEWAKASPLAIKSLKKALSAKGEVELTEEEVYAPDGSRWVDFLNAHDCDYMKMIREMERERHLDSYTLLKEQYELGYNADEIISRTLGKPDKAWRHRVQLRLKKLKNPEHVLIKPKTYKCKGESYTVPAVLSSDIIKDYDLFHKTRAENLERKPIRDLPEDFRGKRIQDKMDYIGDMFSKEKFYGLCSGPLVLGKVVLGSDGLFENRDDFSFSFAKHYMNSINPIRLFVTLVGKDFGAESFPPLGALRPKKGPKKRVSGISVEEMRSMGVDDVKPQGLTYLTRWTHKVLSAMEGLKKDLKTIRESHLEDYTKVINNNVALVQFFKEDEDIENFFASSCVKLRRPSVLQEWTRKEPELAPSYDADKDTNTLEKVEELESSEVLAGFSRWLSIRKFAQEGLKND